MYTTRPSLSDDLTLDDVIARLANQPEVEGLVTIGSTGTAQLTPASDYDLVIVLNRYPAPLHVGLTTVAGRLTDLVFLSADDVRGIVDDGLPKDAASWAARGAYWLHAGHIAYDRDGLVARAQARVLGDPPRTEWADGDHYGKWVHINYNLAHNRRMRLSTDPVYQMALAYRLLYCLSDLLLFSMQFRGVRWQGEKHAFRYLERVDPGYSALWQEALAAPDRNSRFALYEQLCEATCAQVGGLWPEGVTAFQFEGSHDLTPDWVGAAQDWWAQAVGQSSDRARKRNVSARD